MRNRYPLPFVPEMLHRLCVARIFTRLDIRTAYYLVRIEEWVQNQSTVQTPDGQLDYEGMVFRLTKLTATFQSQVDDCLHPSVSEFAECYLDVILMKSTNEKHQEHHIQKVWQTLRQFSLDCKVKKCTFGVLEVGFPPLSITSAVTSTESDCLSAINDWPTPNLIPAVQVRQ